MEQRYTFKLKIEKLVFGGQAIARIPVSKESNDTKPIFVWNALPGEEAEVEITKNKKGFAEGRAIKIISSSPHRIAPKEPHYLSCSPLQILDYDEENKQKLEIAREALIRIGKLKESAPEILHSLEIAFPKTIEGYRNKMEYSFYEHGERSETASPEPASQSHKTPPMSLAFFERSQHRKSPITPCILAKPVINEVAEQILHFVNENHLTRLDAKCVIIRSNEKDEVIAGLFIKNEKSLKSLPKTNKTLKGFHIYLSDYRSPAAVITKVLHTSGDTYLTNTFEGENIQKTELKYGLNSFFQVHQEIFTQALDAIAKHIPEKKDVIDFYSGVGAIGLPLAKKCKHLTLVDSNEEAISYAKQNITLNKTQNAEAYAKPAEKMLDIITKDKIIILDPPRAGLHEDVTKKLLKETPPKIIYLSCNVSTQARDLALLTQKDGSGKSKYKITYLKLFNFFPRTPHIESLCVLEKH